MENLQFEQTPEQKTVIGRIIGFCLHNKLVVWLLTIFFIGWGIYNAPFDWNLGVQRNPVPVDAIPDVGENQQIVFTEWPGRSPQDVEDQITYPLTTALLGIPDIKTIRSSSMFGFSSIYIIFKDFSGYEKLVQGKDFYWTRSRILEKLNSLPEGTLPAGVQPMLGPDATALGQIFWYTLEGRDPNGKAAGGWDLEELRTIQDWQVRFNLRSAQGVSEVASAGGFVREYQVDVDPDALRFFKVALEDVFNAVRMSNIDVGAQTIELNRVEYIIRGVGFIKNVSDIENSVVKVNENVPVLIKQVANVTIGSEARRGAIDKEGAEAVGGVVVARYGANPLAVIKDVKKKISDLAPSLPIKAIIDNNLVSPEQIRAFAHLNEFEAFDGSLLNQAGWLDYTRKTPQKDWPKWLNTSQVTVIPFYDRTGLIYETLGTLNDAIAQEILITIIVVIVMVLNLRSGILISSAMPLAVLACFIGMKFFGVDANIVALSGIAIAIGTIVDMGIVIYENIIRHLAEAPPEIPRIEVVHKAASEVGSAVLTAVATTVVGFLPVFTMTGSEGKLFKPLAYTKTFALIASIIIALTIIPAAAHVFFCTKISRKALRFLVCPGLMAAGLLIGLIFFWWAGLIIILASLYFLFDYRIPDPARKYIPWLTNIIAVLVVGILLTKSWEPLGAQRAFLSNLVFVALVVGILLVLFGLFRRAYPSILGWCLRNKILFLSIPVLLVIIGVSTLIGFEKVFTFIPKSAAKMGIDPNKIYSARLWIGATETFPGLGKEFMPPLDEGSFLYMPTTTPHASVGEALDVLQKQDIAMSSIPEVDLVVGKIGRVESALDPAPIGMIETVVNYKSEYITDKDGRRVNFRFDKKTGEYVRDSNGELMPDASGKPYRQWRDKIRSADDIWKEIIAATQFPSVTSAPKLQPIAARIVMLQSGMRAAMGIKIKGPDLETIEKVGYEVERILKQVPSIDPSTVVADRIVGKPYLEIVPDRIALARYGVMMEEFQNIIEVAVGGIPVTTTVEGRNRFAVRVRYLRELRDNIEGLSRILVSGAEGIQIPLSQVAEIRYVRGPENIKSEDTALVGYVLFDMKPGNAEVDVVQQADEMIKHQEAGGTFVRPLGVQITFAGTYESQLRAQRTLSIILPLALFIIFMLIYLKFRSVIITLMIFTGVFVAASGGFLQIWLYGQPWFMNFDIFDVSLRELFQMHNINMSVAIWVGFLALFGIATDDGVIMATYQEQLFRGRKPKNRQEVRSSVIEAGKKRVRPCLMTTATTILALLPVLTSKGRGSDIMIPMAIPSFGGMTIEVLTMLVVPVLYCALQEHRLKSTPSL